MTGDGAALAGGAAQPALAGWRRTGGNGDNLVLAVGSVRPGWDRQERVRNTGDNAILAVGSARPTLAPWFSRAAFKSGLAAALLALCLAGTVVPAAEPDSVPHRLVAKTAADLTTLIKEAQGYAKEDPEHFYAEVDQLLSPAVDFKGFARGVMAAHYKQATAQQRSRFAETFKWSLIRAYALALTDFTEGEVVVLPAEGPPRNPRRQGVRTEIHTGTEIYPVTYTTTLGADGIWRIGNINIAGVNIGLTYRSQFASMAADNRYGGDLDRIIQAWAEFVGKGLDSFAEGPDGGQDAAAKPASAP